MSILSHAKCRYCKLPIAFEGIDWRLDMDFEHRPIIPRGTLKGGTYFVWCPERTTGTHNDDHDPSIMHEPMNESDNVTEILNHYEV